MRRRRSFLHSLGQMGIFVERGGVWNPIAWEVEMSVIIVGEPGSYSSLVCERVRPLGVHLPWLVSILTGSDIHSCTNKKSNKTSGHKIYFRFNEKAIS